MPQHVHGRRWVRRLAAAFAGAGVLATKAIVWTGTQQYSDCHDCTAYPNSKLVGNPTPLASVLLQTHMEAHPLPHDFPAPPAFIQLK
ncbi:unnamed protein product [Vitrella brassicaformis CCMP3155]|uniref:Uncharacterized protein n=1 Tax=Vitrella brassicaformis (strain CCMP3155) TaxID=1169540 RepID=A0A0G4EPV1_VITBC|nr:unnamed protein product [Vitrella brassicaformis CCMP3155]|eukprot:CEL99603.1 unnamed protein product [Vitrella brassicaformis CCMP3155]